MSAKNCGGCKFFAQGESCSYCENPKQKNKSKRNYLYYSFYCDLHEQGISQTRIDYMNGIKQKDPKRSNLISGLTKWLK